jgi:uncharacterized protein YcbK (DUF882 family)
MTPEKTETFAELKLPDNPFPGLRPFEFDESHLFFGRDGQSQQLIDKLGRHRFLAVVGTSGSGKSSLVRAGLLPSLLGGFMSSAGSSWRIAIMRPGHDPIGNLARALNAPDVFGSEIEENAVLQTALAETTLQRGNRGLVDAVRQTMAPENLLVLVDQFEEIFRFARIAEGKEYRNEAAAFVKLLLEAASQREIPIYVVLTMRSDYLGDCAQFWGLPEAINESQYLIPRLTRDQLREAMTGPINVAGGEITSRLVARLLNDVGDDQDQLPVLQHLLMRVWDEWKQLRLPIEIKQDDGTIVKKNHRDVHTAEAIDLCCYEAVGGMADALSRHADQAFDELLNERLREVAERLFKALAEKGEDNREIRRPATLAEICATANATTTEAEEVIKTFRKPGRSFLMPPDGVKLDKDSLIDISHESLIRGWSRLKKWTEEESQSARIYRRLAETAALHAAQSEGLLKDPGLQIALDWREKNKPNQAWANRYDPGFPTAMTFLDESVAARKADMAERDRQVKRDTKYKRSRKVVAILIVVSVVQLALFGLTLFKNAEANGNVRLALAEQLKAAKSLQLAQRESAMATAQATEADLAMQKALKQSKDATAEMSLAIRERDNAQQLAKQAKVESARARAALKVADTEREAAEAARNEAIGSKERAEKAEAEAITQRDLAEKRGRDLAAQLEATQKAQKYADEQQKLKEQAVAAVTDYEAENKKLQNEISAGLRPEAADLAARLIAKAREKGIQLRIVSGYRSPEAQAALYAQGRTTPGAIVTGAKVSSHNTGLAFDVASVRDGKVVFSDEDYKLLGPMGEELGLIWGGNFRIPDKPHFETKDAQDVLKKMRGSSGPTASGDSPD